MYSYVSEYHSYVAVFTRISLAYGGVYLFVTPGTRTNWVFGKLHVIGGVSVSNMSTKPAVIATDRCRLQQIEKHMFINFRS